MRKMLFLPSTKVLRLCIPVFLLIISAVALGSAYLAEYVYNLKPCTLCLYQRIPFAIIGVLGVMAFLFGSYLSLAFVAGMAGLVLLSGAGIAIYHLGIEQHWWASAASCNVAGPDQILSMSQFKALLQQQPEASCQEITWNLFGISMATYNAVYSGFCGLVLIFITKWLREPSNGKT